jgi:ABC-type branched-subunit amino acid transport system ATPase component
MAENNVILQVQDVTMQFGGLRAIDNVSFHVDEAEIFGLIGPNGAGKTTLFNVITANYKPTSGSVTLAGTSLKGLKPNQVVNAGIARTFQNIRLFNSMTVLENVMVGLDRAGGGPAYWSLLSGRAGGESQSDGHPGGYRHRPLRPYAGHKPKLWQPAQSGDRPRAGHRAEAAPAR